DGDEGVRCQVGGTERRPRGEERLVQPFNLLLVHGVLGEDGSSVSPIGSEKRYIKWRDNVDEVFDFKLDPSSEVIAGHQASSHLVLLGLSHPSFAFFNSMSLLDILLDRHRFKSSRHE